MKISAPKNINKSVTASKAIVKSPMTDFNLFYKALSGFFFNWGGDTPSEVYWAANDLLEWYEKENNIELGIRFDQGDFKGEPMKPNFQKVMNRLREVNGLQPRLEDE